MSLKRIIILTMVAVLWLPHFIHAAEFHVTTPEELQSALSGAADNDKDDTIFLGVEIKTGIYFGNFTFSTAKAQTLSIKPESGLSSGQVVLDGGANKSVLSLDGGDNIVNFSIDNIVIQNGNAQYGAGIYIKTGGNIDIANSTMANNKINGSYARGGGLYLETSGQISIQNSIFRSNSSDHYSRLGGGLYVTSTGPVIIKNSTFTNNYANGAGAYVNKSSSFTFEGNNVSSNSGYGIFVNNSNTVRINYCSFTSNSGIGLYLSGSNKDIDIRNNEIRSNGRGVHINTGVNDTNIEFIKNIVRENSAGSYGGIYIYEDNRYYNNLTLNFYNNTIALNKATYYYNGTYGGGSIFSKTGTINFLNNIVYENTATKGGGGISISANEITCTNNIITKNKTLGNNVGGLYLYAYDTLNLINNTISDNSATVKGGGVYLDGDTDGTMHLYNNIVWGNTAASGEDIYLNGNATEHAFNNSYHGLNGNVWNYSGNNIDEAPRFVNSANNDYHLISTSGCLNVGKNDAPELPATDRDGYPRIADVTVDLGAYEHDTTDYHPADTDKNWNISSDEFDAYGSAWKNSTAWSSLPSPIPMNYATSAGYLLQSGGDYQNSGGGKPGCWTPKN